MTGIVTTVTAGDEADAPVMAGEDAMGRDMAGDDAAFATGQTVV